MFGDRLKELRIKRGLSQEELSRLLNTKNANISNWERGTTRPDIDTLKKISFLFDVSTDYLLNIQQNDMNKIRKLKYALQEAGLMVGEDLTIEELEKALQIVDILKNKKDTN